MKNLKLYITSVSIILLFSCSNNSELYLGKWKSVDGLVELEIKSIDGNNFTINAKYNFEEGIYVLRCINMPNQGVFVGRYNTKNDFIYSEELGVLLLDKVNKELIPKDKSIRNCCSKFIKVKDNL